MVNYQLGKIYKLYCVSDESLFYIGSTAQKTLADRLKGHVKDYKHHLKMNKKYMTSFKVIETGNYKIELLESYPCSNRDELTAREGYYIKANPTCVNKNVAGRTKMEYREDNEDKIKKYREENKDKMKQYREENKDKLRKQKKEYRRLNRVSLKVKQHEYYIENTNRIKAKCKIYYQNHKDKIKHRSKEYRKANQNDIHIKASKKFNCDCGSVCRWGDKARHLRTKKHQVWKESQRETN